MAWFKRTIKGIRTNTKDKKDTPEGLWHKTPTGKIIDTAESASAEKEGSTETSTTETSTTETPPQSGGFKARNLKYHNKISSKTRKRIMERGYKRHGRSLDK